VYPPLKRVAELQALRTAHGHSEPFPSKYSQLFGPPFHCTFLLFSRCQRWRGRTMGVVCRPNGNTSCRRVASVRFVRDRLFSRGRTDVREGFARE
jgi:hypothetical protein